MRSIWEDVQYIIESVQDTSSVLVRVCNISDVHFQY